MDIELIFQRIAEAVALGIEAAAILFVAIGAAEAIWASRGHMFRTDSIAPDRRVIWMRFAGWILMALEFTLGADVIDTAISPSWDAIGKLAAIATIRTALSFFLTRDIESEISDQQKAPRTEAGAVD